eukprot:11226417-Lingulodinium_polyedra.AAC.1
MRVLRQRHAYDWRQHAVQLSLWESTTHVAKHRAGGLPGGGRSVEPGPHCTHAPTKRDQFAGYGGGLSASPFGPDAQH